MIDTTEINLQEDECCIVFDFGCYFPYSNCEILTFDFSLGMETFDDYKLNHRYPNKGYQTISKKYGRKISKCGYPYVMKLDKQRPMLLCIKVGIKDQYFTMVFPLVTNMTKENPICLLTLHYMFDENVFGFSSPEKVGNGCWNVHRWHSHAIEDPRETDVVLNCPHRVDDSFTIVYEDTITPYPMPMDNGKPTEA